MARLNQNLDNLTFHQGWYGICAETEVECAEFNLISGTGDTAYKLNTQIHAVYEVRPDSFGQLSYNGNVSDGSMLDNQQIKSLECGHSYLIVLKKGDGFVDIENFVPANSESDTYRVVSSCEVEDATTPKSVEATPTPKPQEVTPTPILEKRYLQLGADIVSDQLNDYSGYSMSMSELGNAIAISAIFNNENGTKSGKTTIYEWDGSSWNQKGSSILGEASFDHSGMSVALCRSGNNVVIGAPYNDDGGNNSGHARVYNFVNGDWQQKGVDIDGTREYELSGISVAMSSAGNCIAVASVEDYRTEAKGTGFVHVYEWVDSEWKFRGSPILGEQNGEFFGYSIAMDSFANVIAISAPKYNRETSGRVAIYKYDGKVWHETGELYADDAKDFGYIISFNYSGSVIAVGSPTYGSRRGLVRVYEHKDGNWIQLGNDVVGKTGDVYGLSVALSGNSNTLVIGSAYSRNEGENLPAGETNVFQLKNNEWSKVGITLEGDDEGEFSGSTVATNLNGNMIAISNNPGVKFSKSMAPDYSYVRVYKLNYDVEYTPVSDYEETPTPTPIPQVEETPTPIPVIEETPTPIPQVEATPTPHDEHCTDDVMMCWDGSYVSRDMDNNCEFFDCPEQPTPTPTPQAVDCTDDVMMCWDGSYVSRNSDNNCEFFDCPEQPTLTPTPHDEHCADDVMMCWDGSYVSRDIDNNCEFFDCPEQPTPTPKNPTPTPKEDDIVESPCIEDGDEVSAINGKYVFGSKEYKTPYTIGIGAFILKNVPIEHPIFLVNADETKIKMEGSVSTMGSYGTGYTGDVKIIVSEDFGTASYMCANHGYMGGQDNLVFDVTCPSGVLSEETPKSSLDVCQQIESTQSINTIAGTMVEGVGLNATGTNGTLCYHNVVSGEQMKSYTISLGGDNYEEGGITVNILGELTNLNVGFIRESDGKQFKGELLNEDGSDENVKNIFYEI